MTNKTNINFEPPYLKWQLNAILNINVRTRLLRHVLMPMYVHKAMNINSNATFAIVDCLFRLVRDGSALHGPVVRGIRVMREQMESRLVFMLLDRSRGVVSVLSPNRLIGLRGTDAPRTSMLCRVREPKHETYCDVRPGSVLAL